jgi:hypothetical protein
MSFSERRASLPARDAKLVAETRDTIQRSYAILAASRALVRVMPIAEPEPRDGDYEGIRDPDVLNQEITQPGGRRDGM